MDQTHALPNRLHVSMDIKAIINANAAGRELTVTGRAIENEVPRVLGLCDELDVDPAVLGANRETLLSIGQRVFLNHIDAILRDYKDPYTRRGNRGSYQDNLAGKLELARKLELPKEDYQRLVERIAELGLAS